MIIHISKGLTSPVKLILNFSVQLHTFCDVFEKTYAATLYTPSGEFVTHLLAAKTKVAPINVQTSPRLELCCATLLGKMVFLLHKELNLTRSEAFY